MGAVPDRATVDHGREQFKEGISESRAELLLSLERIPKMDSK
jgi:hypothetical protein